jgi:hypothetical protein
VNILTAFPRLYFLNLSNNLLTQPIDENSNMLQALNNANLSMRKVFSVVASMMFSDYRNVMLPSPIALIR